MLAGAGTAESVLVVMAMSILSHDQTGLKQGPRWGILLREIIVSA